MPAKKKKVAVKVVSKSQQKRLAVQKKGTKKKKAVSAVHVGFVLDKSGSMNIMRQEAVDAFNQQLEILTAEQKKTGIKTFVSFQTFDTTPNKPLYVGKVLKETSKIGLSNYVPNGMTAMRDAVAEMATTLEGLGKGKKDVAYLLIIITDGQENASKVVSSEALAEKLRALQATGKWTITYQGANQDLTQVARTLSIPVSNTMAFQQTDAGILRASSHRSVGTSKLFNSYASGQSSTMDFYDLDKDKKGAYDPNDTTTKATPLTPDPVK